MPLILCPNDNGSMQTVNRSGVEFDMCPTCRGVWLDRGELEKLLDLAGSDAGQVPSAPPPPHGYARPDDRSRPSEGYNRGYRSDHDDDYRRRKKRSSLFDLFD